MWTPWRWWFDLKAEFRIDARTVIRGRDAARAIRDAQQRNAGPQLEDQPMWKSILFNLAGSALAGGAGYAAAFGTPSSSAGWGQLGLAAAMAALFNQTGLHQTRPVDQA